MDAETIDDIMESFHCVGTAHDVIQNTPCASPPPLDQSFYLVPSPNQHFPPRDEELQQLKNLCDAKNSELIRLKTLNDTAFYNIKKAMEKLSPDTIHLFPRRLKSRFVEIQEQNEYLRKKVKKMKRKLKEI